jgi:hypothetical protein
MAEHLTSRFAAIWVPELGHSVEWPLCTRFGIGANRKYEGVSRSFRTGRLERELQMVQLSATRCSCIAVLWVILVSFAAITLCVASQRVFVVVVYFVIDSVRKLFDTSSYISEASGCPQTLEVSLPYGWTEQWRQLGAVWLWNASIPDCDSYGK